VGSLVRKPVRAPVPVTVGGSSPRAPLRIFFCGSFVPLQGVPVILDAAALCPELEFRIVGDGPGAERIVEELDQRSMPNVDLECRFISREELTEELAVAAVVLGVFGASEKTGRVVPCKVYDALAAGRCVVSGDGAAPRQLLRDGEEILLVRRNDPAALAAALRKLAGDEALRDQLAANARSAYEDRFSRDAIGQTLVGVVEGAGVR
jgi:glycosyltransferase involved in cell wall biosynthesis